MKEHMLIRLNEIRQARQNTSSEDERHHMINFAARIITPINIGTLPDEVSKRRHLEWDTGTLRSLLTEHFNDPQVLMFERMRLPKTFDAWSLCKIGGIKIRFTDNLADHLLLVDDDAEVLIFHHVSYLKQQGKESLLPAGLAEETIKTIALLFPQAEYSGPKSQKRLWLAELRKCHEEQYRCCVDECLSKCGGLPTAERQIEKFSFWRERLGVLKQAYDETTLTTLLQWWHARSNGPQWLTFWISIVLGSFLTLMGLFLSMMQVVQGTIQVYLAAQDQRTN